MSQIPWDDNQDGYYEHWEIEVLEETVALERQQQDVRISQRASAPGLFYRQAIYVFLANVLVPTLIYSAYKFVWPWGNKIFSCAFLFRTCMAHVEFGVVLGRPHTMAEVEFFDRHELIWQCVGGIIRIYRRGSVCERGGL
jgi:hypothetical protein